MIGRLSSLREYVPSDNEVYAANNLYDRLGEIATRAVRLPSGLLVWVGKFLETTLSVVHNEQDKQPRYAVVVGPPKRSNPVPPRAVLEDLVYAPNFPGPDQVEILDESDIATLTGHIDRTTFLSTPRANTVLQTQNDKFQLEELMQEFYGPSAPLV